MILMYKGRHVEDVKQKLSLETVLEQVDLSNIKSIFKEDLNKKEFKLIALSNKKWIGDRYTVEVETDNMGIYKGLKNYVIKVTDNEDPNNIVSGFPQFTEQTVEAAKELETEEVDRWVERKVKEDEEFMDDMLSF